MKIKLYGETYTVVKDQPGEVDAFYYNKDLQFDPPAKGKCYGYFTQDDGSVVAVYQPPFSPLFVVVPIAVSLLAIGIYFFGSPLLGNKPKVTMVGGKYMVASKVDGNAIGFNAIPQYNAGKLDLRFKTTVPATVSVSGDGIYVPPTEVGAMSQTVVFPAELTGTTAVTEADLIVTVNGQEHSYPIVIEMPGNDKSGGDGTLNLTAEDDPFANEEVMH